jgi:hypothetical protein
MKTKNARKPIKLMPSTMLDSGDRRPSQPAKTAETMPTSQRGAAEVFSTAI